MADMSVSVLFYGDYPALAARCLNSIINHIDTGVVSDLRLGLNSVSEETRDYIYENVARAGVPWTIFECEKNVYKYPLMRRMFYSGPTPLPKYVMWFDDDSYITGEVPNFFEAVSGQMLKADMLGWRHKYLRGWRGDQKEWVRRQPWYDEAKGFPTPILFHTGGWWTIRSEILQKWDWPTPELLHNGGDYTLGTLLYHQNHNLVHFQSGYFPNSGERGGNSTSTRRGETTEHVGVTLSDYTPGQKLKHQEFDCKITTGQQRSLLLSPINPVPLLRVKGS